MPTYKAYKTVYSNTGNSVSFKIGHFVNKCESIANCTTSNWFNYCSKCESGTVYGYTKQMGVQYDMCIPFDTGKENKDCYAAEYYEHTAAVGPTPAVYKATTCKYCRKGYNMNPDGICEEFNPPRCAFG